MRGGHSVMVVVALTSINLTFVWGCLHLQWVGRDLQWAGLHKDTSLNARLEPFTTHVSALLACSRSGMPQHGNCMEHNTNFEWVVWQYPRAQLNQPGSNRQRYTLVINYSCKYQKISQIPTSIANQARSAVQAYDKYDRRIIKQAVVRSVAKFTATLCYHCQSYN